MNEETENCGLEVESRDEDLAQIQLRKRSCTSSDRTTNSHNYSKHHPHNSLTLVNWETACAHMILKERNRRDSMTLITLIEAGEWDLVRTRWTTNPDEFSQLHPDTGKTPLHELCAKTNAPADIIQHTAQNFPKSTKVRDLSRFESTPLHILCLNSQRTFGKVQTVVDVMSPDDLLLGNAEGDTALHLACAHNACFQVLQLLIRANPALLVAQNHQHRNAFSYLRRNYFQSIPGHMAMTRILNDREVLSPRSEGHFERFWQKIAYYATETLKYLELAPREAAAIDDDDDSDGFMLLGMLQLEDPRLTTLQVVLKRRPDLASRADVNGNYPLHYAVQNQYFGGVRDAHWIQLLLEAYPQAALCANNDGDVPLMLAIRGNLGWDHGLRLLVQTAPQVLSCRDPQTRLYPFLLAASYARDEEEADGVSIVYQMLVARPDLVQGAVPNW